MRLRWRKKKKEEVGSTPRRRLDTGPIQKVMRPVHGKGVSKFQSDTRAVEGCDFISSFVSVLISHLKSPPYHHLTDHMDFHRSQWATKEEVLNRQRLCPTGDTW